MHIGHSEFLDTWQKSLRDNVDHIDTVFLWLSDRETSEWYTLNQKKFHVEGINLQPICNFQSNAIDVLHYINNSHLRISAALDFDDIWLPQHVLKALNATSNFQDKAFYAGCSLYVDKSANKDLGGHMVPKSHYDILLHTPIAFSAMVWRPGYVTMDPRFNRLIDQSIAYFAFKDGEAVVGSDITVKIRRHRGSMSGKIIAQALDRFKFFALEPNPYILLNLLAVVYKKFKLLIRFI